MYKDIEEEEHSSGSKLIKLMDPYDPQEWSHGEVTVPNCCLDAADEPSPLGLRLEKTPSLVDLIQLNLSQKNLAGSEGLNSINQETELTEDSSSAAAARAGPDKRKATNFSASVLRIGTWECVSRYEGDLVVKCYFAKRKLVWEVLEGGLKSKIEIQWSDITALKASCPDHQLGTLDIELSRPPTFFKESNPQPRKHTLWQTTSDFTGGQATIYRRHILQFFPGVLDRHYEKLIQCDSRLNMLSKKGIVGMGSPYFDSIIAPFQNQAEQRLYWALQENKSHVLAQPAYLFNDYDLTTLSSLSDAEIVMAPSLVPKFEHFNPEEKLYGNTVFPRKDARSSNKIDEIAQYLLSDSLVSDDQSIITRVNSMCSFLQEDINREGSWFR